MNIFTHRQQDKTDKGTGLAYYASQAQEKPVEKQRHCKNHLFAWWKKMDNGEYFPKCSKGFKYNEDCEVLKEE